MKGETENKKRGTLRCIMTLLPLIWKASPGWMALACVLSVAHGLAWGVAVPFQQRFFDAAAGVASGSLPVPQLVTALLLFGMMTLFQQVLNGVANFIPSIPEGIVRGQLGRSIHEKAGRIAPILYEDTDCLDTINKAQQGMGNAYWFICTFLDLFLFYLPYFGFMSWYLFRLKPLLVVSILLVFIPALLTQIVRTKLFTRLEDKSAPVRRETDYYESCIDAREYYKETRILGGFLFFHRKFGEIIKLLHRLQFRYEAKANLLELAMKIVTVLGYGGILLMLFDALMKREISVGAFAAVLESIGSLYGIMEEVICYRIAGLAQDMGTIRNYLDFLDMEERGGEDRELPDGDIAFQHVTFSYPKAEVPAVRDVSFTLHKGETLAIVGENGSGKSTLIRLLTGLYLPDEGVVLHSGLDTRQVSMPSLFRNTSAVFQKYQRYQMTLRENLGISETGKPTRDADLDPICAAAGIEQMSVNYPEGYDTMLSREFDGVDLSGGQWQRIAIGRSFFRTNRLIILDEPTAAIDPLEETAVYNRFANLAKDKTAVIVTHRLGSVRLADRILVMKEGVLAEQGTHEELLLSGGEYARLYKAQEQWYA